jgi:hypothetical protein
MTRHQGKPTARDLRPVLLYLPFHILITAATWRDLKRRPSSQVRGSKRIWRIVSAANTLGSLAYLVAGRKPS